MITITRDIIGMTCSHCEGTVTSALEALPGVASVTANAEAGTAVIELTGEWDDAAAKAAVTEAGYELA